MNQYDVWINVHASVCYRVRAESEEEAVEMAYDERHMADTEWPKADDVKVHARETEAVILEENG